MNKKPTAKTNLSQMNIYEVALADIPAVPGATFALFKSNDLPEDTRVIKQVPFIKNAPAKQVYAYVLVPDEPDWQGDVVTAAEIEKAAHSFMHNGFNRVAKGTGTSHNHTYFDGVGYPIASVIDKDGALGKANGHPTGVAGGWWMGVQVTNDDLWGKIEKGEITGFSIGGEGVRTPIEPEASEGTLKSLVKRIVDLIKADGNKPTTYTEAMGQKIDEDRFWEMSRALNDAIRSIAESDVTNKAELLSQSIDQYKADIIGFFAANKALDMASMAEITKFFRTERIDKHSSTEGDQDMDEKKLQEMITGAVTKATESLITRIDAIEKANKPPDPAPPTDPGGGAPDLAKVVQEAVDKAVKPVADRLAKIEGTPEKPNGGQDDSDAVDKTTDPKAATLTRLGKALIYGPIADGQ